MPANEKTITAEVYTAWLDHLYELMDWRKSGPGEGDYEWKCGDPGTGDGFALAKQAAADIGQPFDALKAEADRKGRAGCDCELLFNCDERDSRELP